MLVVCLAREASGRPPAPQNPSQSGVPNTPQQATPAQTLAQGQGSVKISLDDAIQMALQHNHSLLAARTTIQQSEAEEITANLRPNPVLLGDAQFLPIFQPNQFSSDYLDNSTQFDVGLSYLFERGKKRQHRLQAAQDVTAVTRSQVADNERGLTFNVAQLFTNVELAESTLELAQDDLKGFQNTVDISQARYNAGDISLDDLLKIKIQMLQFQTDVSQAKLARVQGLSDLRQLLGYESVPADYDLAGSFDYQP
jgi:cobalt-zinc-cadmium efflux system outer membrane protein